MTAAQFKALRRASGLTAQDAARLLGISTAAVRNIECSNQRVGDATGRLMRLIAYQPLRPQLLVALAWSDALLAGLEGDAARR